MMTVTLAKFALVKHWSNTSQNQLRGLASLIFAFSLCSKPFVTMKSVLDVRFLCQFSLFVFLSISNQPQKWNPPQKAHMKITNHCDKRFAVR
jgi:hypothetical protein